MSAWAAFVPLLPLLAAAVIALRGIGWETVLFLLGIVWAGDSAAPPIAVSPPAA